MLRTVSRRGVAGPLGLSCSWVGAQARLMVRLQSSAADVNNREVMQYDVCIVGAGPAGLSAAIKIKQVK